MRSVTSALLETFNQYILLHCRFTLKLTKQKISLVGTACTVHGKRFSIPELNWMSRIHNSIRWMYAFKIVYAIKIILNLILNETACVHTAIFPPGKLRIGTHSQILMIENGWNRNWTFLHVTINWHRMCCHMKGLQFKVYAEHRTGNIEWKRGTSGIYL